MKLTLLTVVITLSISVGCNQPEEVLQYYTSGEISRRHTEINGKKEGKMTEYYKDGKIRGERMFENDLQEGKTTYYYPSGKIKEAQYFEQGKLHGGDTLFYENGKPQFLRNYNHGALDGYIRKWGVDGSVIYEAKYANDTLIEVKGVPVHPDTLMQQPLPADTLNGR
jgi:antitoxin component YwqK of YwqJK toxin-antitoxin module